MPRKPKKQSQALSKAQASQLARKKAALKEQLLKRRKRQRPRSFGFMDEALDLYDEGEFEEVCDLIRTELALHPEFESIAVLEFLGDAAVQCRDAASIARAFRRLTERVPSELHYQVNYAGALLQLALPYLALRAFERLNEKWPHDPLVQSSPVTVEALRRTAEALYADFPWGEAERWELATLHEEMLYGISLNDFAHVIPYGEKLLVRDPDFPPAFNNLALAYRESGRVDDAIRLSQELLARDPQNSHAILILGDSFYARGRRHEARETWQRLRHLPLDHRDNLDSMTRQIEALARLGDDEAVLTAVDEAESRGQLSTLEPAAAVTYHLAGVAAARTGRHRTASEHWDRALEINPNYHLARENREDHEQPVGERDGPWIENRLAWLPRDLAERLLKPSKENESDEQFNALTKSASRRVSELYPELPDLVGDALSGASPEWRQMVILLCQWSDDPALHHRLREFALGPRGSDKVRFEAAQWLKQKGLLPGEEIMIWARGEQTKVLLLGMKISYEGQNQFPEIEDLQVRAYTALKAGEFARAERLYRECLAIVGEHPSLLFNLSSAIAGQGRVAEGDALRDDIAKRWQDYFFGKLHVANRLIDAHDLEGAEAVLRPLMKREEFHISEYLSMCFAFIDLEMTAGRRDAAEGWLRQAKQLEPEHPGVKAYISRMRGLDNRLVSAVSQMWKRFIR